MVDQIHICRQALAMDHHHIHHIHHELLVSELQTTKKKTNKNSTHTKGERERMNEEKK